MLDGALEILVGAPGGAEDIDEVELLMDPKVSKFFLFIDMNLTNKLHNKDSKVLVKNQCTDRVLDFTMEQLILVGMQCTVISINEKPLCLIVF